MLSGTRTVDSVELIHYWPHKLRRFPLMGCVLGLALVAGSCGQPSSSVNADGGTSQTTRPGELLSSSVSWRTVGDDIREARGERDAVDSRGQKRISPVLSDPIDIVDPGSFEMRAGPVDFAGSVLPELAYSMPLDVSDYATVRVDQSSRPKLIDDGGQIYITFGIVVSTVVKPYRGLTIWVQ
jgi:hypothetical protein